MKPEALMLLEEVRTAIAEIEAFVDYRKGFAIYTDHRPSQIIAERLLEVIGESVKKMMRLDEHIILTDSARIASLRNRIAHDYSSIEHATVFVILTRHLPVLKEEVEALLKEHG